MIQNNPHNYFFPTGYQQFHKRQLFNFQLNRPYSWGYADFNDLKTLGNGIHDLNDWKTEMTRQSMYISGINNPMKAFEAVWLAMNEENIYSKRVFQDVLLLSGEDDHFIPIKMHKLQKNALVNAKSVTDIVFTKKDQAQNHCQIGNVGLALDIMSKWIEEKNSVYSLS